MASEPPVSPETPTPTPEKKSHTTRNALIIVLVIVVILALFFGLFFGLRGCDNDNPNDTPDPDDVNPDPDIVEPGPVEEPDGTGDDTPVATSITVTEADSLTLYYNTSTNISYPESLDLRNTITVTVLDQFGNEYTGDYGSSYTLSTTSSEILLDTETGVVTAVTTGTAEVIVTSLANKEIYTTIDIEVIPIEKSVTSISASIDSISSSNILLDWGATSDELQVTFDPTDATVQTYEVTPNDDTGLFTYDKTTNTFTHTRLNTGTETFTITATDQSNSAYTTITLECDPVIDEPYEVVWKDTLPETIAKGESITDLNNYVEVHFDHTGQDEHEYVDDSYTLSYVSSNDSVISISETTASFTGDGGTSAYITVTATPEHDANPVYAVSSGITITQAVTGLSLNYSEYVFKPLKSNTSVTLEVVLSPDDCWPIPEIEWTITGDDENYLTITPNDDDKAKCLVEVTKSNIENDQYVDDITITAVADKTSVDCDIIISTYDFATDSWMTINQVSSDGIASKVYDIGDTKENVSINSEEDHTIRIIGFDHDELTTEDEGYSSSYNDGEHAAITCEMMDCLSTTHKMDGSETNSGGWYSCGMRSYLNSDSGCVLSTLDNDLQSVIKKVDKKSTKGGASTELGETASDSLFLLAIVELNGTTDDGYKDEGTQYAYYSEHNNNSDRAKTVDSSANDWWLRSPRTVNTSGFCNVNSGGYLDSYPYYASTYLMGVSFAFCI